VSRVYAPPGSTTIDKSNRCLLRLHAALAASMAASVSSIAKQFARTSSLKADIVLLSVKGHCSMGQVWGNQSGHTADALHCYYEELFSKWSLQGQSKTPQLLCDGFGIEPSTMTCENHVDSAKMAATLVPAILAAGTEVGSLGIGLVHAVTGFKDIFCRRGLGVQQRSTEIRLQSKRLRELDQNDSYTTTKLARLGKIEITCQYP